MNLNELGEKYGTDKSARTHNYLMDYEEMLSPLAPTAACVLEIGVKEGASVQMWRDFFPVAEIVGVDIEKRCTRFSGDRINIEIGSQDDPAFMLELLRKYRPDVIIDDGSHQWDHQIFTFQNLYPSLSSGGIFIVEDVHTSRPQDKDRYGNGQHQTAASFFGELGAHVSANGPPADKEESPFSRYVRKTTRQVIFGRRYVAFRKK